MHLSTLENCNEVQRCQLRAGAVQPAWMCHHTSTVNAVQTGSLLHRDAAQDGMQADELDQFGHWQVPKPWPNHHIDCFVKFEDVKHTNRHI